MRGTLLGCCLTLGNIPFGLGAQQAPTPHQLWRYTSHEAIAWRHITNLGTLLLGSDSGVTSLDLASGAVQWRRTDLARLSDASTWYPPATPYLLIRTDTSWAVVDLATGTSRWDRSKLPFSIIFTAVVIPERRLLLVAGHKAADVPITVAALGIDSGMLRWESDSLLPMSAPPKPPATFLLSPAQPPFLDSDTTAILLPESGGQVRLDTRNGRLLWRQPAVNDDDPPFISRGYARLAADSGVLYVP